MSIFAQACIHELSSELKAQLRSSRPSWFCRVTQSNPMAVHVGGSAQCRVWVAVSAGVHLEVAVNGSKPVTYGSLFDRTVFTRTATGVIDLVLEQVIPFAYSRAGISVRNTLLVHKAIRLADTHRHLGDVKWQIELIDYCLDNSRPPSSPKDLAWQWFLRILRNEFAPQEFAAFARSCDPLRRHANPASSDLDETSPPPNPLDVYDLLLRNDRSAQLGNADRVYRWFINDVTLETMVEAEGWFA